MTEREKIAFSMYYNFDFVDNEGHSQEILDFALKHWREKMMPELKRDHGGDCTGAPMVCMRCVVEEYLKIADEIIKGADHAK